MSELDSIERQVLKEINTAVLKNGNRPITLDIGGTYFTEITGARRYSGSFYGANRPYTDIIIEKRNTKGINLAFSNSVLSESMERLEIVVPGIKYKFIKAIVKRIESLGLDDGDDVPNFFGAIDSRSTQKLIEGTYSVGGPINFMYLNIPKILKSKYNEEETLLFLPGNLINIKNYSKELDLYLRLVPIHNDQKYDSKAERGGYKLIYGESPSRGESGNRIIVTTETTSDAVLVEIE